MKLRLSDRRRYIWLSLSSQIRHHRIRRYVIFLYPIGSLKLMANFMRFLTHLKVLSIVVYVCFITDGIHQATVDSSSIPLLQNILQLQQEQIPERSKGFFSILSLHLRIPSFGNDYSPSDFSTCLEGFTGSKHNTILKIAKSLYIKD